MLKTLLTGIGIKAAPPPYRQYLAAFSAFGFTPVALFLAWKNRDRIASAVRALTHHESTSTRATAAAF